MGGTRKSAVWLPSGVGWLTIVQQENLSPMDPETPHGGRGSATAPWPLAFRFDRRLLPRTEQSTRVVWNYFLIHSQDDLKKKEKKKISMLSNILNINPDVGSGSDLLTHVWRRNGKQLSSRPVLTLHHDKTLQFEGPRLFCSIRLQSTSIVQAMIAN